MRAFRIVVAMLVAYSGCVWFVFQSSVANESRITLLGGAALVAVVLGILLIKGGGRKHRQIRSVFLRGRRLIPFNKAQKLARKIAKLEGSGVYFGFLKLPKKLETNHFLILGATGSGKSVHVNLMMMSILPMIGRVKDVRAIIYDGKMDILPRLRALGATCPIYNMNPFADNCDAWDIAKDVTSAATAYQLASILIPKEKGDSSPYFTNTGRAILAGIIQALRERSHDEWTLRDLCLACRSRDRIVGVLSSSKHQKHLVDAHFQTADTSNDVVSTISTNLAVFEYIAAVWSRAPRKIALRDWVKSESVLVIGNDEEARASIDLVNQVLLKRISELVLALSESDSRRTWIFLDEVREAGKLEGLRPLLLKGRSKGACVALSFQDTDGLKSVYGELEAKEIIGQCGNKAILRLESPDTARWAESLFCDEEIVDEKKGFSSNFRSVLTPGTVSVNADITRRPLVLAAEFRSLPVVTKRGSMQGFYDIAGIGSFQCGVKTTWIGKHLPSGAEVFERIDATALLLEDWEMSDLDRLAIVPPPPPPSASGAHAPDGLGHASIPAETTPTVNDVPGDLVPPNESESTASLGLERATKIALAAAAEEHGRTDLSLVPDKTIESPAQWLFFYDTVGFLSTGDEAEALEVSYPIMVNRGTGEVSVLKRSSTSARRRSPEISTVRISLEGSNH